MKLIPSDECIARSLLSLRAIVRFSFCLYTLLFLSSLLVSFSFLFIFFLLLAALNLLSSRQKRILFSLNISYLT